MIELHANERLIIERLFDRGVFTSTIMPEMKQTEIDAIMAFKRPVVQRRIMNYLRDLFGVVPDTYQENLVFLLGYQHLTADEVHVLLATLKAVLNEPSLQASIDERVVATQVIVRQVRSEVVDLDEKLIFRLIRQLFVERFKLFTPERLEQAAVEQEAVVEEYWSVNPDFTSFAQCMVNSLQPQPKPPLNEQQQVIQALLMRPFLSPQITPKLWQLLISNQDKIVEKLAPLQRFELEIGADYALLLDRHRPKINSKPYTVALSVARSLGIGLPEVQLSQRIHQVNQQLFNNANEVALSLVRAALFDNGLAIISGHNIVPTAVVNRFAVQITEEEEKNETTDTIDAD